MILDLFKLDGRVAIVTGAGKGIGRGIAKAYAEAGADVAVAARTESDLESLAEEIRGLGRRALAIPTDVLQSDQLDALVERTAKELGRIDVVVNNAGGTAPTPLLQQSDEAFEAAFRFNVGTARHLSQRAIPHMLEGDGGAIVNISSGLGHLVDSGFTAYGTAKAALSHLTRLMACEFAPRVRVNALAVGGRAQGADGGDDAHGPPGLHRGHRRGRALPGLARRGLGDRQGLRGGRRHRRLQLAAEDQPPPAVVVAASSSQG